MHTPIYKNVDVLDKSYGGQWRRYLWGIGARSPSNFGNSMHTTAAANLTVQILKINKEKHVLNFHLSRQKHSNTHVNRLKQPLNQKEIPGRGGEERVHAVPPHLISWRRHWRGQTGRLVLTKPMCLHHGGLRVDEMTAISLL